MSLVATNWATLSRQLIAYFISCYITLSNDDDDDDDDGDYKLTIFFNYCKQSWVFILSLLGLTPLAERVSFLTE
jgi:hypothetical protein